MLASPRLGFFFFIIWKISKSHIEGNQRLGFSFFIIWKISKSHIEGNGHTGGVVGGKFDRGAKIAIHVWRFRFEPAT